MIDWWLTERIVPVLLSSLRFLLNFIQHIPFSHLQQSVSLKEKSNNSELLARGQDIRFAQPAHGSPSTKCFEEEIKLNVSFISDLLPQSGCSPSMCSARVRSEQKRNRKGSHIQINILQCSSWYSGSCGRMLDNIMEMSAATTSTVLKYYALPQQRSFRVSGYRWKENTYFHFNSLQILT